MIPEIYDRRSIRKFLDKPISQKDIMEIIQSGVKAPSSKNRQPWKYIVIQGNAKEEMLKVFHQGINREENENALLPQSKQHIAAAKYTINIMEELTPEERVYEICNIQSISASIQNMLLAATEKGIGSLWICDIYFAYSELCKWLNSDGQLIAAIAFGYPNESPKARPRKNLDDIVEWRN